MFSLLFFFGGGGCKNSGTIDFVQSHFILSAILGRRGNNGTICIDFYNLFIHVLNIETGRKNLKLNLY